MATMATMATPQLTSEYSQTISIKRAWLNCFGRYETFPALLLPRPRKVRETITSSMKHVAVSGPEKVPVGLRSRNLTLRLSPNWESKRISVDLIWDPKINIATTRIKPSLLSIWLVVWLPFFVFPRNIGFLIIPIDEFIFFRGVAQPPTRYPCSFSGGAATSRVSTSQNLQQCFLFLPCPSSPRSFQLFNRHSIVQQFHLFENYESPKPLFL